MKNILVLRFSSLGDIVLTTGVLKFIKDTLPSVNISVATSTQFKEVFEKLPFISAVYSIDRKSNLKDIIAFSKTLPKFDAVFDLHDNLRSRILKFLLPAKSFTYNKNSLARRSFVRYRLGASYLTKHTVQKYFEPFGRAFNLNLPDIEKLRPFLIKPATEKSRIKRVVIHPFASKFCKEWPYFYDLSEKFLSLGVEVAAVGAGGINLPDLVEDKTGFVTLETLKENIASADLFITTDSGPLHIATAMNVPTVAIFGPTTRELGFYPTFKDTFVIENEGLNCRPCHIHGPDFCPKKHFRCMKELSADMVFDFSFKLLK